MTDQQQPTWRQRIDGADIAAVVSLALIAAGTVLLWGVAIMLLVLGIIGAAGVVVVHAIGYAAARGDR